MVTTRSGNSTDIIKVNPVTMSSESINGDSGSEVDGEQEEVTNAQLQQTLKSVLSLAQKNETSMTEVSVDINKIKSEITSIKDITIESEGLKEQLYSTQGKVAKLERKNQELEEKLIDYEYKMYSKDLMFYNVEDEKYESEQSLKTTIYHIIENVMKIPLVQIFSRLNPAGEVRLDTVTRMGRFSEPRARPVIVTFTSKSGRNIVYSKTHTSNLKEPVKYRVAEHFPAIVKERRQVQIDTLKTLRTAYKDSTTKVTLDKDRILVNGKLHNSSNFERNPLPASSPLSINFDKLSHSDEITEKASTFQAHSLHILTKNQATAAINSIYQNPTLSVANHIMYAYKIGKPGDAVESGFNDDSEIEGGKKLMQILDSTNTTNTFLCVTRIKKGGNIGPNRFKHIEKCAKDLLKKAPSDEPTLFNHITFNQTQ